MKYQRHNFKTVSSVIPVLSSFCF